jgi:hypothetical protein
LSSSGEKDTAIISIAMLDEQIDDLRSNLASNPAYEIVDYYAGDPECGTMKIRNIEL